MSFTETEMEQLKTSYETLRSGAAQHPGAFYDALFSRAPELRPMFREDLEGQGMKFMTTLGVVLARLRDEDAVDPQFQELGAKHAALGVRAKHFAPMEEALIETIRDELGSGFSPGLEALWRKAFRMIAARMIRRGDIPD